MTFQSNDIIFVFDTRETKTHVELPIQPCDKDLAKKGALILLTSIARTRVGLYMKMTMILIKKTTSKSMLEICRFTE